MSLLMLYWGLSSCLAIRSREELLEIYPEVNLDEGRSFDAPAICDFWHSRPDSERPLKELCQYYWGYDTARSTIIKVIGSYGEFYVGKAADGQFVFGKQHLIDRWVKIVKVAKKNCPQSVVWGGFERLVSSDSDQFGPICSAPAPTLEFVLRESSLEGPAPLAVYSVRYAGFTYGLAFVEWPVAYTNLDRANDAVYLHSGITYYRGHVVQTFRAFPL